MTKETEVRFVNVALAHSTTFQLIRYRHSCPLQIIQNRIRFLKVPNNLKRNMGTERHHASAGPLKPHKWATTLLLEFLGSPSHNMSQKSIC